MALVVVDTDIASKLFRKQLPASWLDRLGKQKLAVSFVTIGEAVYGAERKRWGTRQPRRWSASTDTNSWWFRLVATNCLVWRRPGEGFG